MEDDSQKIKKSYDEAAKEIACLEERLAEINKERDLLLKDITHLRSELGSLRDEGNAVCHTSSPISSEPFRVEGSDKLLPIVPCKHLAPERIELFQNLFRGREDVYAKLWSSKRSGKEGYSPDCKHEWTQGICAKPKVKCAECPNREFLLLTEETIKHHGVASGKNRSMI